MPGMTTQWCRVLDPDVSKYAENCGGLGIRATQKDKLDEAMAAALAHPELALVEIVADPELI